MTTFQKYGLNRQNTAIEKALIETQRATDAVVQVVTVSRDTGAIAPGDQNGSLRVTGRNHAALSNPISGWETIIDYWEIVDGVLTVYGTSTGWDSFDFILV